MVFSAKRCQGGGVTWGAIIDGPHPGTGAILADVRSDVARLNASAAELERTMGEANPLALECFPDGASVSTSMSGMAPPPLPSPAEARAREASLLLGFNHSEGCEELDPCSAPPASLE
jgi:hypothetical protein